MPEDSENTPNSTTNGAPITIVGLYGVSGCGKTFLLNQLKESLKSEPFAFYDGSQMIRDVVFGGLEAFKKMSEEEMAHWRKHAIEKIGADCAVSGKVGVVAGHFMFWSEKEAKGQIVCTESDLDTYTHVLYLDVPAEIVAQRAREDRTRNRELASTEHLRKWQENEKVYLRDLCMDKGILFSIVSSSTAFNRVGRLLRDFQVHSEQYNMMYAKRTMDQAVLAAAGQVKLQTMLVLDADKTLAAVDAGAVLGNKLASIGTPFNISWKTLFDSPLKYSYTAFRQAALLNEDAADDAKFEELCQEVANELPMHPEFVSLLRLVGKQAHVGAVVVTAGLRRVWEKVLLREGFSESVKVIGGGRIEDGFVVDKKVKRAVVEHLQKAHGLYVFAFGDSPLDLGMLCQADQAVVAVCKEDSRSKSMEKELMKAIDNKEFKGRQVRQALLPSQVTPRLDESKLPVLQFGRDDFVADIIADFQILHATELNAAKMLMTPMRDARVQGHILREAHRRVGWYLATEFLTHIIGVEEYKIPHVQGSQTDGYRLYQEPRATIVALMRGGEPMAFGVNEAFPLAMFLHAKGPEDLQSHHLHETVVLVDSVVNSGKTIVEFVEHIRRLKPLIRIVVITGVAQIDSVHVLRSLSPLALVALRLSHNKFTGRGTTDTGNRLFNTTSIE